MLGGKSTTPGRPACCRGMLSRAGLAWGPAPCLPNAALSGTHLGPSLTPHCPAGHSPKQNGDINEVMAKADKMAAEIAGK